MTGLQIAWIAGALTAGIEEQVIAAPPSGYEISRIDDGTSIVREPVISDTGLVVWSSYRKNSNTAQSDIIMYKDGRRKTLTDDHPDRSSENVRPQVYGQSVVWISSYQSQDEGTRTWTLVDPPDRDGHYPELNAHYRVTSAEDGNAGSNATTSQTFWLPPVNIETNENASAHHEHDTNVELAVGKVSRHPSGKNEVVLWEESKGMKRVTVDHRNDLGVSIGKGNVIAWQKSKGFPFGWEIMAWKGEQRWQITTNYYYDMAPKVSENLITWYGWDGEDYEIFLYDLDTQVVEQITSNRFDDVSPVIWGESIAWEAYPAVEADIYAWSRKTRRIEIASNNTEDDINPRIWGDYVVWQGFDGDDFEIWVYEITTGSRRKLTGNGYDDVQPEIRDGRVVWMGYYDNWDAEIFVADLTGGIETATPLQLTDNEFEDRDPKTAGGRVVWQADEVDATPIYLATPN